MGSYKENLIMRVIEASEGRSWDSAVSEWEIIDCEEDEHHESSCICGKEDLRFLFTIQNRYNHHVLYPIGSRCIRKFERQDLDEITSIHESLFKLLLAQRNRERIELTSEYFSRKLLRYRRYCHGDDFVQVVPHLRLLPCIRYTAETFLHHADGLLLMVG